MNQTPYIFCSPRTTIRHEVGFSNQQGLSYRQLEGEHAIWIARIPFLPAMVSDDFTRMGRERLPLIMRRQFRFIYDLARSSDHRATFVLRFCAERSSIEGKPNTITILFLGKVFVAAPRSGQLGNPRAGQKLAERLWDIFINVFPLEDPFNYPVEAVTERDVFHKYYEPIPYSHLERQHILEVRKYEDLPVSNEQGSGRVVQTGDYIAYPFVPSIDFSAMGRFLTALAYQPQRCFVDISLRPTRLYPQETHNIGAMAGRFKQIAQDQDSVYEEYIRTRALVGAYIYQNLMQEREQLVTVRVQVVGEYETPYGLAEAVGTEMIGNIDNKYPTQWVLAQPADEPEFQHALLNLRYLEQETWGHTIADPRFHRLRYLATAQEAFGAFRLPIPPESGYIPGVLIKNEPFVSPADEIETGLPQARKEISLGIVYHRGNSTNQKLTVSVRDLTRHTLIAGSTGSGKSTTIKYILNQLWGLHQIPFLVLYPIDKTDYRELRGYSKLAADLLIFTLGDETTSPFRFNPFEVTENMLLKTHVSRLMRVFMAAFELHDPLPMIYREALRRVYQEKGWNVAIDRGEPIDPQTGKTTGASQREYPVMADFYRVIGEIADSLQYGREVQDNVRQASVIRIGDLLENAGNVVNVRQSMPLTKILQRPTIMEIGRVGSMQDTALLMGFLLMKFAAEVERNPRPKDAPHITVVEEAHRLMAAAPAMSLSGSSQASAGEDFSNILAEVRGFGEGLIIAEQIPTLLVKGAIGNTYLKVMHWLEDPESFELFSSVVNLNESQQTYARTLTPGFALVRSPAGKPVHVKVPDLHEQDDYEPEAAQHIDDGKIRKYMQAQIQRMGIADVAVEPWQGGLQARLSGQQNQQSQQTVNKRAVAQRLIRAPMRSCVYCRPLLEEGKCPHRINIQQLRKQHAATLDQHILAAVEQGSWQDLRAILNGFANSSHEQDYCALAHVIEEHTVWDPSQAGYESAAKNKRANVLRLFDEHYKEQ